MKDVLDLEGVSKKYIKVVGGKAAALGELIAIGVNVPTGFVITTKAFTSMDEKLGQAILARSKSWFYGSL